MFSKRLLFMLLYTPAAMIISVTRPFIGLLMLVSMYYFRPDIWAKPSWLREVMYITLAVIVGWLLNMKRLRWSGLMTLAVFSLLGMVIASALGPSSSAGSRDAWYKTYQVFKMIVVMFLVLQLVDTPKKFTMFMWANVFGMIWNVKTILVLGLSGGNFDTAVRVDVGVAQGGGANYLAMVLAMTLPFFQVRLLEGRPWERRYALLMSPLYILCIIFTGSRGGFLSMFAAGLFVILRSRRKVMGLTLGALGLIIFLAFLPQQQLDRFLKGVNPDASKRDFAAQSRVELWKAGWRMFLKNPVHGVGIENFIRHSAEEVGFYASHGAKTREGKRSGFVAHSTWFQTLAEGGVLLALPFFSMFALFFAQMARVKKTRCRDPDLRRELASQATALQGLMIAFMVASTFGSHLSIDFMWWYFGLAAALHALTLETEARDRAAARLEALAVRREGLPTPEPVGARS